MAHRHDDSAAIFKYAHVNKSIIYVTMHKQESPINMFCCVKAPKTQKIAVTDIREKTVDFFYGTYFSSRNNLANLGFFTKVFVSVIS